MWGSSYISYVCQQVDGLPPESQEYPTPTTIQAVCGLTIDFSKHSDHHKIPRRSLKLSRTVLQGRGLENQREVQSYVYSN